MSKLLNSILILFLMVSCSSSSKKAKLAKAAEAQIQNLESTNIKTGPFAPQKFLAAKQLTSNGENAEAYFSADSKRILYHSKKRTEHPQTQIYELNLATMRERRITFHDGEDANAVYTSDPNYIIYSSTTDEIKEEREAISSVMKTYAPNLLKKHPQVNGLDFRPFEIYLSKIDGSQITRLTKSPGYDAEASVNAKSTKIVFVSARNGSTNLYLMPFSLSEWTKKNDADPRPIRLTNDNSYNSNPIFVPQTDQILWIKYSPDLKTSQIMLGDSMAKNPRPLTSKPSMNWSPFFNPLGKEFVFSSNRGDGVHFNLYTLDITNQCLKRLTDSPDDEILPAFSPDAKKLLFTSNRSGKNQIYIVDYISPHACLDELP